MISLITALFWQMAPADIPEKHICTSDFTQPCVRVAPESPMHLYVPIQVELRVTFDVLESGHTINVRAALVDSECGRCRRLLYPSIRAVEQWVFYPGHPREDAETTLIFRFVE
ncbi:MAG: hypothetical protein P8J78_11095 [Maricaulis sp.]|nr:hypothetical protein [Maricaulis sp.]